MKNKRNGAVELYRFLFAVLIMLRHGKKLLKIKGVTLFSRASLGVEFFFFVSGFLMAMSAKSRQNSERDTGELTSEFLLRKYKALMPEFLFAMAISFILSIIRTKTTSPMSLLKEALTWFWELLPVSMAGFTRGEFHMASWYISAMLLGMLILYPICLKWFDSFTRIIAPILTIFILGILQNVYGTSLGPGTAVGFLYKGLPRAIAELSAGAMLFPIVEKLKSTGLSPRQRKLITVGILFLSAGIVIHTVFSTDGELDMFCALMILTLVLLLFSHQGSLADKMDNPFCAWLGKYSLTIYLCHGEFAKMMTSQRSALLKRFPALKFGGGIGVMVLYFIGTAAIVIVVTTLSNLVRNKSMVKTSS